MADKLVFISNAARWAFVASGVDKSPMTDQAAQRIIDVDFQSEKLVLTYGRHDGRVRAEHESPQLKMVAGLSPALRWRLVVDFQDTYPGKGRVVTLEDGSRVFNLWSEPRIKPVKPEKYQEPRWFLDVVERFFGEEHTTEREYFLDWCAHLVCRPAVKMPVSVLLISSLNGAGKGFIGDALMQMVGEKNTKKVTSGAIKGSFQSFIPGTTLVVIPELYEGGNYSFADGLKSLQSEDELFINLKYGPQENVNNACHFLAFSNNSMPIRLEESDRRWFVFASPQKARMPTEWWSERWRFIKDPKTRLPHLGALGSLRRWFEARIEDIERTGRFKPHGMPPTTEHKEAIIEDSRSVFFIRLKEMLENGKLRVEPHGRISLGEIAEQILEVDPRFKRPPNGQASADLETLGFTYEKKPLRRWVVPADYQGPVVIDI